MRAGLDATRVAEQRARERRAAARLPTPGGPWSRYACAGPSASAASSRRFASGCSGTSAKALTNLLRDLRGPGAGPVDDDVALRDTAPRGRGTRRPHAARTPPPPARSGRACRRRARARVSTSSSTRKVRSGSSPPTARRLSSRMASTPRPRPRALVGDGRVEVPVADDGRAARERRVGSPGRRAARARRGRAPPPPTARRGRRGGRDRGSPPRAACRPARGSRRRRAPSSCLGHLPQPSSSKDEHRAWVVLRREARRESHIATVTRTSAARSRIRPCGRSSRGVRGSSGRRSSTRWSTRGDEVHVVDDLSSGRREQVQRGGDAPRPRHRRAAPGRLRRGPGPRSSSTSPRRSTSVRLVADPVGGRAGRTCSGRSERARGGPRRTTRRSSSRRPEARSTASATGRRARTRRGSRCRRTGRRSSPPRSTSRRGTGCTAPGTSRCGSATSTARARTRTARRASSRSSSPGSATARRRRSTATARQTRDYVFVGDVARAFVGAVGAEGGVFNVGTGEETSVVALWQACLAAAGDEASRRCNGPARLGELQRSCLDPRRAETTLLWRAEVPLATGPPRDVGVDPGGMTRGAGERVRVVDHPIRLDRVELAVRPWRTATVLIAAVAAIELVLLIVVGRRAAREARAPSERRAAGEGRRLAMRRRSTWRARAARSAPAELPRRKVRVVVLNGNGRQGAAAAAAVTRHRPRLPASASSATHRATTTRSRSSCTGAGSRARGDGSRATSASRSSARSTACAPRSSTAPTPCSSSAR